MLKFSFKRGLRFFEGTRPWTVLRRLFTGKLQLEDQSGEICNLTEPEIMEKYSKGEFVVDTETLPSDQSGCHIVVPRDLSTYSTADQKMALRRQNYLMKLSEIGPIQYPWKELFDRIQKVSKDLGDDNPPSPGTVIRWNRRFKATKSVMSLVSRNENKGRRCGMSAKVIEIIDGEIEEIFLNTQKHPKKTVVELVQKKIAEVIKSKKYEEQLKLPSRATIYRYLDRLYKYQVDISRLGNNAANLLHWASIGQIKVKRIHERWEIDHTPLDLLVFCEESGLPMGRPWLTIILDKKSRYILGFYISFGNPSANSVLQAIVNAILPKELFLARYPDIKAKWLAGGIGETIFCDNGMDLHAGSFIATCFEIGMNVAFCPAKTPQYKGSVERFFRTINHDLIHQLPGTVFNNPKNRGEYESEKLSTISFQTLTHLVTKWIVEVYHQTPHRALRTTPHHAWTVGMKERVIEYPASPDQLRIIAGQKETRSLFRYGLVFDGLKYNNDLLQSIRRRTGETIKMDFKFYEEDVGHIHVYDPHEKAYIRVDAVDQEYAKGLHRAQHRLIREEATAREWDHTNIDRLMEVKTEMREMVNQATKDKKMIIRKKNAKARGIDSNRPEGKSNDVGQKPKQFNFDLDIGEGDDIPEIVVERGIQQQSSFNMGA